MEARELGRRILNPPKPQIRKPKDLPPYLGLSWDSWGQNGLRFVKFPPAPGPRAFGQGLGCSKDSVTLGVQVPKNHILTQNQYPNPKYLIIGSMEP